jgi:hypothetical protein
VLVAALGASTVDGNTVRSERFTLHAPVWLRAWLAWLGADGGRERAWAAGRRFGGPVRRAAAYVRLWLRPGAGPRRPARPGWPGQPTPPRQPRRYRQAGGDAATRSRKWHRRGPALRQRSGSFRCSRESLWQHAGSFRQRSGSLRQRKRPFWQCRGPFQQHGGPFRQHGGSFRQYGGPFRERKRPFWQCCGSLRQRRGSLQQRKRPFWQCCGSFQPRQRPDRGRGSRPQAGRAWGRRRGTPRQARRRGEGLGPDT